MNNNDRALRAITDDQRRTSRYVDAATWFAVGLIVAVIAGVAWIAVTDPVPVQSKPVTVSDELVCDAGEHAQSWYGFDTSYTAAGCYDDTGDPVMHPDADGGWVRSELLCKWPSVVSVDEHGASCQPDCEPLTFTAEQLDAADFGSIPGVGYGEWVAENGDGRVLGYADDEDGESPIYPTPACV